MTKSTITMTYEEWLEKFKPMKNPTDPDAPFDGCLIDTSKEEMAFVAEQNRLKVWTLLESDGVMHIGEGVHFVNRMGYFVTEVPRLRPDQQFYEVKVSDDDEVIEETYPALHFVSIGVADVRRELTDAQEGGFSYPALDSLSNEQINDLLHYCYKHDKIIWEHAHVDIPELEQIAAYWKPKAAAGEA